LFIEKFTLVALPDPGRTSHNRTSECRNGGAIGQPVAPLSFWALQPILPDLRAPGQKVQLVGSARMDRPGDIRKAGNNKKKGRRE
jgi:hypothetical protein